MKLSVQSALACLAVMAAIGCGGTTGQTTTTVNPPSNPYFGTYSGGVYAVSGATTGTVRFSVNNTGAISGSYVLGATTTSFTGTMSQGGLATISDTSGNTSTGQFTASNAPTVEASLSKNGSNVLDFTVLRDPTGTVSGGNPINGSFSGVVTNQATGTTEPISLSITTAGSASGDDVLDDNGAAALGTLSGSVTTTGLTTLTADVNGSEFTSITATLTLSNGNLTGTGTNTAGNNLTFKMALF